MAGVNSISVLSNPVGRSRRHAPGSSAQPIFLHKTTMIYTHVLNRGPRGVRTLRQYKEDYADPYKLP
jgi:hypothetical protein